MVILLTKANNHTEKNPRRHLEEEEINLAPSRLAILRLNVMVTLSARMGTTKINLIRHKYCIFYIFISFLSSLYTKSCVIMSKFRFYEIIYVLCLKVINTRIYIFSINSYFI